MRQRKGFRQFERCFSPFFPSPPPQALFSKTLSVFHFLVSFLFLLSSLSTFHVFFINPSSDIILVLFLWPYEHTALQNQCFLLVSCAVFCFLYRLLMVTCRLDKPSCLQMCHSSLLSYFSCYVFLLSGGCVSLCLLIFIFLGLITFHLVVCLSCLLSWWDRNPDETTKYLQILIVIFCFGASIPTLSLGPDNNPTRPREEPLKKFVFCCLSAWSSSNVLKYLFLLCFYTSSSYKVGPKKNDNVSQNAKPRICVLKMVCLERRKHSCSLKHRT